MEWYISLSLRIVVVILLSSACQSYSRKSNIHSKQLGAEIGVPELSREFGGVLVRCLCKLEMRVVHAVILVIDAD